MYWDGLDTDTKARLIRDGLRMGMRRWESVRDAYDAAEERRLAAAQDGTDEDGDVIIDDPRGQWAHPCEVTRIPSNEITMRGVPYPVVGVSDTGDTKVMEPGYDYVYDGSDVTEFPLYQYGGQLKSREAQAWEAETKRRIANHELPNAFQLNVIGNIDRRGANTDFIQRARDPYRQTIPDWEGRGDVATHKLGWAADENGVFIYPEVQRTDSGLVDYSGPAVNGGDRWMAADRARQTGDYVMATPLDAKVFTENYKKFYQFGN